MQTITRTEQAGTTTYTLTVDGEQVSFLDIDSDTRKVTNVETAQGHGHRGYASTLWEHANGEAECFHALEHHRTPEGDAFARSVGGYTIDADLDHIDECCICTGEMI